MNKLDLQVARDETWRVVRDFLCEVINPDLAYDTNEVARAFVDYYHEGVRNGEITVQQAAQIDFGVGKSQTTVEVVAYWVTLTGGRLGIAVQRLELGERLVEQLRARRIDARLFRGRNAPDPDNPGKLMCWRPAYVDKAVKAHAKVKDACCYKNKNNKCIFLERCGYYGQQPGRDEPQPRVWVFASDMIFHEQEVFAGLDALIIDESFWQKGIRGVDRGTFVATIADLGKSKKSDPGALRLYRERLAKALNDEVNYSRFTPGECRHARMLEWEVMPDHGMEPKENEAEIEKSVMRDRHLGRCRIKIWEELELLLHRDAHELPDDCNDEIVSGRLTVMTEEGERVIRWRGVEDIRKNFRVPTLLLDATLPARSVLQVYHPEIKVVADIMVDMPKHVKIKQILKTPTSSNKLEKERHLKSLRRYILQRWIECRRGRTLVITQEKAELWLQENLPKNIFVEHFNNIAGLDDYRDVRLLILVGRSIPGPEAPEALAAALSGDQPITCKPVGSTKFVWYPQVKRGIRLRDGRGIATDCDQHPDPFVESVRMMICEHELLQAIGRARGVNRTGETPLDIDLLFNVCLPRISVDGVVSWKVPTLLLETAHNEGVVLTSVVDLMKAWPDLWPNHNVADRTLRTGVPDLPGFVPVPYQLVGAKMNERLAYFDLTVVPYPMSWIEERLGPVADRFKDLQPVFRLSSLPDTEVESMIASRHQAAL
jgi:putative DNA primase/helicase